MDSSGQICFNYLSNTKSQTTSYRTDQAHADISINEKHDNRPWLTSKKREKKEKAFAKIM